MECPGGGAHGECTYHNRCPAGTGIWRFRVIPLIPPRDSTGLPRQLRIPGVMFRAGQKVRVKTTGSSGRVFLKLPAEELYLVQMPGFPVVEKLYYGSDLEPIAHDRGQAVTPRKR